MRAERQISTLLPLSLLGVAYGAHAALRLEPLSDPGARAAGASLQVTSDADGGRGSLREALFDAMLAERPAPIRLAAATVAVRTPLPPLFHPRGIALESAFTTALEPGRDAGPALLQIAGGDAELAGLAWRDAGVCLRVAGGTVRLRDVKVERCAIGVELLGDTTATIEASRLDGNGRAVQVGTRASARIADNFFGGNESAVWAVAFGDPAGDAGASPAAAADPRLVIVGNRFEDDRVSLVLGAIAAEVEDNDLLRARQVAAYLGGGGIRLRRNRVHDARSAGIVVVDGDAVAIEGNDLRRVARTALVVIGGRANLVRGNRLRDNGLGILAKLGGPDHVTIADNELGDHRLDGIYVLAAAPRLRANRIAGSRRSDLRIADLLDVDGRRRAAAPRLEGNRLGADGAGAPVRSLYRMRRAGRRPDG